MRIEIDTKHDTKEDLAHLANMLKALSAGHSIVDNRFERKLGKKLGRQHRLERKPVDLFEDSSPNAGFMNIFGDNTPAQPAASQPAASEPVSQAGSQDLFSIFGSADSGASSNEAVEMPKVETYGGVEKKEEDEDVLKDIRIVPY